MRSASALRFSKGCSSLNLDRMMDDVSLIIVQESIVVWIVGALRVVMVFDGGCFVMVLAWPWEA